MRADQEWLATLKVGDKVVTSHNQWSGHLISVITRITPTQFVLGDVRESRARRSDGHLLSGGYARISPVTDHVLEVNERIALLRWLSAINTNDRTKQATLPVLRAMKAAYDRAMQEVPCTAPQP